MTQYNYKLINIELNPKNKQILTDTKKAFLIKKDHLFNNKDIEIGAIRINQDIFQIKFIGKLFINQVGGKEKFVSFNKEIDFLDFIDKKTFELFLNEEIPLYCYILDGR